MQTYPIILTVPARLVRIGDRVLDADAERYGPRQHVADTYRRPDTRVDLRIEVNGEHVATITRPNGQDVQVQRPITRTQLDALTDVGTLDDARLDHRSKDTVSALRTSGLIEFDLDSYVLTDAGVKLLEATGRDLAVRRAFGQNV